MLKERGLDDVVAGVFFGRLECPLCAVFEIAAGSVGAAPIEVVGGIVSISNLGSYFGDSLGLVIAKGDKEFGGLLGREGEGEKEDEG